MSKLRDGSMSPDERSFLENEVIRDLQNNRNYGRVTVVDSLSFDNDPSKDPSKDQSTIFL
ncbi:hypothetical protein MASR2M78_09780 [Treponema sp.]